MVDRLLGITRYCALIPALVSILLGSDLRIGKKRIEIKGKSEPDPSLGPLFLGPKMRILILPEIEATAGLKQRF
jgi:hypothetical protein